MQFKLLSVVALAATAMADISRTNKLVAQIQQIERSITNLNNTMASWNGNLLGAIPMLPQSRTIVNKIEDCIKTAMIRDETPTQEEAQIVNDITEKLARKVGEVMGTVVNSKTKFERLDKILTPLVFAMMKNIEVATMDLGNALMTGVPLEKFGLHEASTAILKQYEDHFAKGKSAYQ